MIWRLKKMKNKTIRKIFDNALEELDKVNKYYMKENMLEKGDDDEK